MGINKNYKKIKSRRAIIIGMTFISLVLIACGSKPRVYHVGILCGAAFFNGITEGFKEKMTGLGYVEGTNIIYDIYNAMAPVGNQDVIKKFIGEKVDLIVVYPTEASIEAKSVAQGSDIPVVFVNAFTEDTGLVNSIQEPGGNITGVRWPGPDGVMEHFEIMLEILPNIKSILTPSQKDYPITKSQLDVLRKACRNAEHEID